MRQRLKAVALINPRIPSPSDGNQIKSYGPLKYGNTYKPDEPSWLYHTTPSSRAIRARSGNTSVRITYDVLRTGTSFGGGFNNMLTRSEGYVLPNAYTLRNRKQVLALGWPVLWDSSKNYIPCNIVKYYYGPTVIRVWEGEDIVDDHIEVTLYEQTLTNEGVFSTNITPFVVKSLGWTPESEGYQQVKANEQEAPANDGWWWKEFGTDITDDLVPTTGTTTNFSSFSRSLRDAEIDTQYTYNLDAAEDQKISFNPKLDGGSPFGLFRMKCLVTINFLMVSYCLEDKYCFVGRTYNVKIKYDKFKCSHSMSEAGTGYAFNTFQYTPDGSAEYDYSFTVTEAHLKGGNGSQIPTVISTFEWDLPQDEARQITDFMLVSIT